MSIIDIHGRASLVDDAAFQPPAHRLNAAEAVQNRVQLAARRHHQPSGGQRIGGLICANQRQYDAMGLAIRSEEHTSELQSLMRISYAVFCLKKKKKNTED